MKTLLKEISPLSLAFSFALVSFSFCFRADNLFIGLFEAHETTLWFLVFFIVGGLCIVGLLLFQHTQKQRNDIRLTWAQDRPSVMMVSIGGAFLALGEIIVFPLMTDPLYPEAISCIVGLLVGFGFLLLVYQWSLYMSARAPWSALLNTGVALLGASLVDFWLGHLGSTLILCLSLGALSILSSVFLASYSRRARNPVSVSSTASYTQTQSGNTALLASGTAKKLFSNVWAGYSGAVFNFFTIGLTFWPQLAGLPLEGPSFTKPAAYCIILLVFCLLRFISLRTGQNDTQDSRFRELELYYRAALPIGVMIVLATPFISNIFPLQNILIISWLPYSGIALLYLLGFTTLLWTKQVSKESFSQLFIILVFGCAVGLIAGLIVFRLLEQQAQIVSLCLLSLYLAMMVLEATKDVYNAKNRRSPDSSELLQDDYRVFFENYDLSPREQEIFGYLAKGRGAKHIADKLHISSETVRTHTKRIYEKVGVHTKEDLLDLIESRSEPDSEPRIKQNPKLSS